MNRALVPLVAAAALAAPAAPASAQNYGMQAYRTPPTSRDYNTTRPMTPEQRAKAEKNKKLAALRKEAIKLQKQDGGALSADHKLYIQGKMDAINGTTTQTAQAPAPATPQN
jgi:hypothetical protein